MSSAIPTPYLDRFITVPEALDFQLKHNPTQPLFVFAPYDVHKQQVIEGEPTEISFLEFVRASHRAAHLVRPGRAGEDRKVVGVVALLDTMAYLAVTAGIFEAGHVPLLISPRLPPIAVLHLLRVAGCHHVLVTHNTLRDLLRGLRTELETTQTSEGLAYDVITFDEIPSLNQLYPKLGTEKADDFFEPYPPATSTFKEHEVAIYLHSSGSTGLPKAIPIAHRTFINGWLRMSVSERLRAANVRMGAAPLPPFHSMAFWNQFLFPIFTSRSIVLFPPIVTTPDAVPITPSPTNILPHYTSTKVDSMMILPSILQIWAQDENDVEILKGFKVVMYGGGPISPSVGNYLVSRGVHLRSAYGTTEVGAVCDFSFDPKEDRYWDWIAWAKETNIRWLSQGDGKSELQFLATEKHVVSVHNIDDVPGYATSDLFIPHPSRPDLWKIVGRADEVLIHSSGEKTVPMPMERVIMASLLVQGVIMFGRQRDQAGVLIEPSVGNQINVEDDAELSKFRNQIWPTIEEANRIAPAYSRIYKEMILITSPNKPLPRTAKNTVIRKAVYQLYEKEIDQIYDAVESNAQNGSVVAPASWEISDVQSWLATQISDICGKTIALSEDIFEHGFDSLCATVLRLRIVGVLSSDPSIKSAARLVIQNTVYKYPTISDLSMFLVKLVQDPSQGFTGQTQEEAIENVIQRYSHGLEVPLDLNAGATVPSEHVVLLTGSTGNLGSYILATLLSNEAVTRVYTLNRPSTRISVMDRQRERFEDKALDTSLLLSAKLVQLEGESSQPNLGLTDEVYNELKESLTLVIHNAWRLDFNLSLPSFEPHVRGMRNLIDLSRSCRHVSSLRFLFTSSIGTTQSWDASLGPYPEEVVMDPKYAVGGGYGESKYISERLLHSSGLHASSFRIGQISGGKPNGAWQMSDWLPLIIKSGLTLNALPDTRGVISWVPTDAVAEAILDFGFHKESTPFAVNLVHPHPVSWTLVMEALRRTLISAKNLDSDALPLIPFGEWIALLEESAAGKSAEEAANTVPATKILEFIKAMGEADARAAQTADYNAEALGVQTLDITNIQRYSPRMKNLEQISDEDTALWVKYWVRCGL